MDVSALFLAVLISLFCSINLNLFLFFKLRKSAKAPAPTVDAQKVLASIAGGDAILRITVIDPSDFFLKSPRG